MNRSLFFSREPDEEFAEREEEERRSADWGVGGGRSEEGREGEGIVEAADGEGINGISWLCLELLGISVGGRGGGAVFERCSCC